MSRTRVQQYINQLRPNWIAADIESVEFLDGGYSNDNFAFDYAGTRYVLRLPVRRQPFVDYRHEHDWYQHLPDNVGVRPEVHDPETGVMLSRMVPGTILASLTTTPPVEELAGYVRRLHLSLPPPGRSYPLREVLQRYLGNDLPALAPSPSHTAAPCHNDLNPWNVLCTADGWMTLDWEFVGDHDPLFDVIGLHQGLRLPDDSLEPMVAAYAGASVPAFSERVFEVLRMFWLRELGWAKYQLRNGNRRPEVLAQIDYAADVLRRMR
jgi:Ser/Thr protein kinase RdoA (MazF antagonist)